MQQEIHMEATLQRLVRLSPFRNHSSMRKFFIKELSYILPQTNRAFSLRVIFYQRASHIHTKSVTAHLQPEAHHILHSLQCSPWPFILHWLLPWTVLLIISIVQCRLMGEEIHNAGTVSVRNTSDTTDSLWFLPYAVCPDISVRVLIFLSFHRFLKPLMSHRCMPRYQIKNDMHISCMCLFKKVRQIFIRAISGRYCIIILHIISRITKRWLETGVDPDRITAQLPDIVKSSGYAVDIPNTVCICVLKRLRIDFIKYCIIQPFRLLFCVAHCNHHTFLLLNIMLFALLSHYKTCDHSQYPTDTDDHNRMLFFICHNRRYHNNRCNCQIFFCKNDIYVKYAVSYW